MSDQGQGPAVGVATKGPGGSGTPLLEIRDLSVSFPLERSTIHALQGLSLHVRAGERLGVVGEDVYKRQAPGRSTRPSPPCPMAHRPANAAARAYWLVATGSASARDGRWSAWWEWALSSPKCWLPPTP